ncbi:MAG: fibronectin type III domain-containing protein [Verrucomicrobia bacterium]|nr:fibronectin type III domain-containing protein [Verrucomicrobiota bacterium]
MRKSTLLCLLKKLAIPAVLPIILFAPGAVAGSTTIKYIQGNYAVPQTAETSVKVQFAAAQTAGDLNVVIVGWNDSSAVASSVKDSKGNVYQLAVGPAVTGQLSQAIYYAKNVVAARAGSNTVTVTFNRAAVAPDIRVIEYSGIDPTSPVDTIVGAIGNSATSSSGTAQTTHAPDLLVAANTQSEVTTGPAGGFTERLLTKPDGDIAEDEIVTAPGSYSAGAPLNDAGGWVMQMVAFRAAGSTAPPGVDSATLAWNADAPTSNPATNPVGYRLHTGTTSGRYTQTTTLGSVTTTTVSNLVRGTTYYWVVTAYNSAGADSPPSQEISYKAP